jgi:hypothetical protein
MVAADDSPSVLSGDRLSSGLQVTIAWCEIVSVAGQFGNLHPSLEGGGLSSFVSSPIRRIDHNQYLVYTSVSHTHLCQPYTRHGPPIAYLPQTANVGTMCKAHYVAALHPMSPCPLGSVPQRRISVIPFIYI